MNGLPLQISNEEIAGINETIFGKSTGILQFINRYPKGTTLTYYVSYIEDDYILDRYNERLAEKQMPLFNTPKAKYLKMNVDLVIYVISVRLITKMLYKRLSIVCALLD